MSNRKHILVMTYMLSPYKGSEFSVAWNYVTEMSQEYDLTVLYGISGPHMGNCEEMEEYIAKYPIPGVNFVAVKPSRFANFLNYLNRHDIFVYTFYYAYQVWQKLAYKKAIELTKYTKFDLVHYVGMIGYREPGYLWKLGLPYVWGPISGANNAQAPQTTIRLKILEPDTLLTANVLFPVIEAVTLTASSGRLVPIATIVIPIISEGTLNFFATEELPSTKKSAPLISRTNPITRIAADFKISIFLSPFLI